MGIKSLKSILGATDIYLLDQILKNRYQANEKILDAGCGKGRNMYWFYQNGYRLYALDRDSISVGYVKEMYPKIVENITISELNSIPYRDNFFNHIISNAVLHFAENTAHFEAMFAELIRILKVGGSLFIRMTSSIGIENSIVEISDGVYAIPDGSTRFLITREHIRQLTDKHRLSLLEPVKTVNVDCRRCMTTLVFQKE
ncbi:MAG TPA: class I SAM-dependent methyltransferase [Flavobacteriia bacterium]|nr:class I SAM-dependent methyltransferase [Flavobacteriia bacterium]